MTDFIIILWAIDALASFNAFISVAPIVIAIVCLVARALSHVIVEDVYAAEEADRWHKKINEKGASAIKWLLGLFVLFFLSFAIPSKDTMEKMAIIYAADTALELEATQKALGNMGDLAIKGSSALNKLLDNYLKEPEEK